MKEANLCQRCGDNEMMENGRFCRPCQSKDTDRQSLVKNTNLASGLCRCGKDPIEGEKFCPGCKVVKNRALRTHRKKKTSAGYCNQCMTRPAEEGRTSCNACSLAARCRAAIWRLNTLTEYGGKCACCGEDGERFLEVDHVMRDWAPGKRPGSETGSQLHKKLREESYPAAYQVLCTNCNWSKHQNATCVLLHGEGPYPPWDYYVSDSLGTYKKSRLALRVKVLSAYGNSCACCGEGQLEVMAIDHIHGGGNAHRRSLNHKSADQFYRFLRNSDFPSGYRVLCSSCNRASYFDGECPHTLAAGPPTVPDVLATWSSVAVKIGLTHPATTVAVDLGADTGFAPSRPEEKM